MRTPDFLQLHHEDAAAVRAEIAEDTLILEVDIAGTEQQLWDAITDPEHLARWSPVVPDRPLTEVGPALSREAGDGADSDRAQRERSTSRSGTRAPVRSTARP